MATPNTRTATTSVSAAVATVEDARKEPTKAELLTSVIDRNLPALAASLPRIGLTPDRLRRIVLTEFRQQPALIECTPASLMLSVLKAAALGLEPGAALGQCYLIPRSLNGTKEVTFLLGYKGVIALARRSGEIADLYAEVVFEGDTFDYALGTERYIKHVRSSGNETNAGRKITHAYAVVKFKNGGMDFQVLDRLDLERRRNVSKAKSGPWQEWPEEMAKKTAIRALGNRLPLSVEAAAALEHDEDVPTVAEFVDAEGAPLLDAGAALAIEAGDELPPASA